jgi:hypothetical protein
MLTRLFLLASERQQWRSPAHAVLADSRTSCAAEPPRHAIDKVVAAGCQFDGRKVGRYQASQDQARRVDPADGRGETIPVTNRDRVVAELVRRRPIGGLWFQTLVSLMPKSATAPRRHSARERLGRGGVGLSLDPFQ